MKTRSGFVSNSSSSSFIAIVTPEAFKEALSRLKDERYVKLLKVIVEEETIFGKKMKVLKEYRDAGGVSSIWGYDDDGESEILEKAGVSKLCPSCEGTNEDAGCTCDDFYPSECVYEFDSVLGKMSRESDWKTHIYTTDVGDGG